jgi:hypothetical protein
MIYDIEEIRAFLAGRNFSSPKGISFPHSETFCPDGRWSDVIAEIDVRQRKGRWTLESGEDYGVQVCVSVMKDPQGSPVAGEPTCRGIVALSGPERLIFVGGLTDSTPQSVRLSSGLFLPESKPADCQ